LAVSLPDRRDCDRTAKAGFVIDIFHFVENLKPIFVDVEQPRTRSPSPGRSSIIGP
jgi:hypothetical protein